MGFRIKAPRADEFVYFTGDEWSVDEANAYSYDSEAAADAIVQQGVAHGSEYFKVAIVEAVT